MADEPLIRMQIQGRIVEGTEQQLRDILQELPDVKQERKKSKLEQSVTSAVSKVPAVQVARELPQTAAGFVEGATAGLPRIALEKAFPGLEIPRGNIPGQIGGFIAGPGKVLNALGRSINVGGRVARPALAGALEGGVGGFAFPQKGLNLEERLVGSALGTGLGLTIGAGIGVAKAFQQSKQARDAIRQLEKQELEFKGTQQSKLPSEIKEEQAFLRQRKAELIKQERNALKSQMKTLDDQLNKEAQAKAQEIKKPLLDHLKRTREDLGASFDDALNNAPEQGLTVGELRNMATDVADELISSGMNADDIPLEGMLKQFANSDDSVIVSNAELARLKSGINRGNFARIRTGAVSPDDVASISFASKITNHLKETVPRFKELSKSYKEFSDLNKFAFKRFTPKASEFEIAPGSNIIKKVAQGKANEGELAAIKLLEKETGIQFTKGAKDIGNKMNDLNNLSADKINQISGKVSKRIRDLDIESKLVGQSNEKRALAIQKEKVAQRELLDSLQGILINARRVGVGLAIAGGTGLLFGGLRD